MTPSAAAERVTVYVDGFNVYHGLIEHLEGRRYRWLNLWSLARSLLLPGHRLERVIYFTSVAPWNPAKARRHELYIDALEWAGVKVERGRFQYDTTRCYASCGEEYRRPVEKLTDVNIATAILKDGVAGRFDWAYLMTGDADQVPTLQALKEIAPGAKSYVIFPFRRHSTELEQVATASIGPLHITHAQQHQFPNLIITPKMHIRKPKEWDPAYVPPTVTAEVG